MAKTVDELTLRGLLGIADSPGRPSSSPYTRNARYLSSLDGFNIKRPAIPPAIFREERDRALDSSTPTGLIPLDLSSRLGLPYPATTPLVLAQYARVRAGERLTTELRATTEFWYVMRGSGRTTFGSGGSGRYGGADGPAGAGGREAIDWAPGDIFCLPGRTNVIQCTLHPPPDPPQGTCTAGPGRGVSVQRTPKCQNLRRIRRCQAGSG